MVSRRGFVTSTIGFSMYALLREASAMVPAASKTNVWSWLRQQNELARGLASGAVSQADWHEGVNALAKNVDVEELARAIKNAMTRSMRAPAAHEPTRRFIAFRDDQDNPVRSAYAAAVFQFDSDSVIAPHGHKHMASAHLVMEGKLRIRKYDRVGDEQGAMILRPTADEVVGIGHAAAMTTANDNVHWFAARSRRAMTFDVVIDNLDPGKKSHEVQPVDVLGAESRNDGTFVARLISDHQARDQYSADM